MGRNEQKPFTRALLDLGSIRQIWWDDGWEFPPLQVNELEKITQKGWNGKRTQCRFK